MILSKYDVYLFSSFCAEDFEFDFSNSTIITLNRNIFSRYYDSDNSKKLILAYPLKEFLNLSHPSFNKNEIADNYYKNNFIGKSVFLSSGSTGKPKLIPLNYSQINSCYNNVFDGFLKNQKFKNIISIHDTSFVIVLPFIFCLALQEDSKLIGCDFNFISNPILNLSTKIKSFDNFILISVPSIFRLLIKFLKDSAKDIFHNENIIHVGNL